MTHGSHSSAESHSGLHRRLLAVLVVATLVLGFWGIWLYEKDHAKGHSPDVFTVLYHSCQLLLAHGVHLEGEVPWQLHAGRLLGAIALFTAGLLAFAKFFRDEMLLF